MAKASAQKTRAPVEPIASAIPKSAKTITVACKIPTGLELQLCKETTWPEETPSGTRMRTRFDRVGPTVTCRGPARPVGPAPKGYPGPAIVVGTPLVSGFPLTSTRITAPTLVELGN